MKVNLNGVGSLIDATTAQNTINANSEIIEVAFDNTLSLDGTAPNQMNSELDMNSRQILNLPIPATASSPVRLQDVQAGGTITNIPPGGTTGQALGKLSNTNYNVGWENIVTSVGLALPADFTVTNSPVTTAGTLTGDWTTPPTGTGAVVRATSPTLVTPALGTPSALVGTNITGTATGLTAGNTTTNANLTGPITSTGNATAIASQTGTGTKFVVDTSPTLVTPTIGVATATSVNKMLITPPATSSTLAVANGKTLTANNTLTLAGTDSTTLTFQGTDTYVGRATTDTLTNKTYDTAGTGNSFKVGGVPVFVGQYPGDLSTANANAGNIGEYVSAQVLAGSAVALSSGTSANITSISLTAGDWDVWGTIAFNPAGSTTMSNNGGWVSTTSATAPTIPNNGAYAGQNFPFSAGTSIIFPVGKMRISLSGTTTVFLSCFSVFAVSTNAAYGFIGARRAR